MMNNTYWNWTKNTGLIIINLASLACVIEALSMYYGAVYNDSNLVLQLLLTDKQNNVTQLLKTSFGVNSLTFITTLILLVKSLFKKEA